MINTDPKSRYAAINYSCRGILIKKFVKINNKIDSDIPRVYWYNSKNFGDAMNPWLIEKISGLKPKRCSHFTTKLGLVDNYSVIGSIFHYIGRKTTVWGSGIMNPRFPFIRPKKILAVRGPLTREILLKRNIDCPEIYGDPTLLLTKYYKPTSNKKYTLGIIPHYTDYRRMRNKIKDPKIKIIDLTQDVEQVIEDIYSCEKTISSALHGLIISHVYNIPSVWVNLFRISQISFQSFKFRDYLQSVGIASYKPVNFRGRMPQLEEIQKLFEGKSFNIHIDLNPLEECCPFRDKNQSQ